jgi:hypothetical protein
MASEFQADTASAYAALQAKVARAVALCEDVNRYERADDFAQTILEALR